MEILKEGGPGCQGSVEVVGEGEGTEEVYEEYTRGPFVSSRLLFLERRGAGEEEYHGQFPPP